MTYHEHPDEQLLSDVGAAIAAADEVPASVIEAAKASFTWRTVDAELAELVFDSTETKRVMSDHLGRFTLHDVPVGPISLRCIYGDDASVVQTDWMLL